MHLIMHAENREWVFQPKKIQAQTSLTESELQTAFYELLQTGYIEPGRITVGSGDHATRAFHVWEATTSNKAN